MSTDHLRWHLLREVNQIALEELQHQGKLFWDLHWDNLCTSNNPALPKLAFLCSLFLSGKEPAAAVYFVLSQSLSIYGTFFTISGKLCQKEFDNCCQSVHLQNLALRFTQFLEVYGYTDDINDDGSVIVTKIPSFVQTLREHNCIEKLLMRRNEDLALDVAVAEACPYLSTLICTPELLDSLLEDAKTAFPKLREIESTYNSYNWSQIFEKLTQRPELFPILETLTSTVSRSDLEALPKFAVDYSIPSIKSYNVITQSWSSIHWDPIDFQLIASVWRMFPNLETASVTEDVQCDDIDPKKPSEVYEAFEKFNSKVNFTFNYVFGYEFTYSKTEVDELETQLRAMGTTTSVSVSRKGDLIQYVVTTSYPNKTLVLKLMIRVDSDYGEAKDSKVKNVQENDSE